MYVSAAFKQVHSDNATMRLKWTFWDILGHLGTSWNILGHSWTFRDNSEAFLMSLEYLDCFPRHYEPLSSIIGSLKKKGNGPTDPRTVGRTHRRTDPLIEMRGRI